MRANGNRYHNGQALGRAVATVRAAAPDVSVASLNVLHGLFCAPETEDCRLADRQDVLVGGIRNLFHVQLDHPTGPVDIFNTHFAAGIDLTPCDERCPPECQAAAAADTRECQAIQVMRLTRERAAPGSLRILGGDFNLPQQTEQQTGTEAFSAAQKYASVSLK